MMSYYYYNQPTTIGIVFSFSWKLKWPQEKLKTTLKQNFGVTNKEHYVMLWYFLEWSMLQFVVIFAN